MKKKLTEKQIKAIESLAAGSSHARAAKAAGVSTRTIPRWISNKVFSDKLEETKKKAVTIQQRAQDEQLQGSDLIVQALLTIQNVMLYSSHDAAKVSAAKYILDRYEKIEDNNSNSNTPNIIDFLKSRQG
jgi:transposase